ncbi:hypothetical protein [Actinoallomurus rhizosphaericola]|uniref:hypothetical protein n=1 Tax=Actinoallomurus rhizosphaericola TaxID=2952536 RepID=UPI002093DBF0|nr:hypothetical protein [Actinoallomurus rhizosphaericola]MCO5994991.1 hypothetical protein [Actinoallomurus rhizosphaericola]
MRHVAMAAVASFVPVLWVASPASADTPKVELTVSNRLIVNYVERCTPPEDDVTWAGDGPGVSKVVMRLYKPSGERAYSETARPGEPHIIDVNCSPNFGKWTVKVTAYNAKGKALAERSASYWEKGNTQIKALNAAPEPVRAGGKVTVTGRLMHVKYRQAPWYIGYAGKPIRVYFKATGASSWRLMGSTTTGRDGRFRKSFTARKTGAWRAYFPGTSAFDVETSPSDVVKVR